GTSGCSVFFFQAEDGIRDRNVTGVQTCALPISLRTIKGPTENPMGSPTVTGATLTGSPTGATPTTVATQEKAATVQMEGMTHPRSEERRVGKECRCRWAAQH